MLYDLCAAVEFCLLMRLTVVLSTSSYALASPILSNTHLLSILVHPFADEQATKFEQKDSGKKMWRRRVYMAFHHNNGKDKCIAGYVYEVHLQEPVDDVHSR